MTKNVVGRRKSLKQSIRVPRGLQNGELIITWVRFLSWTFFLLLKMLNYFDFNHLTKSIEF